MLTKVATVAHVALLSLILCGPASAAPSSDWSRVERLPQGRGVAVTRTDGEVVRGRIASISAEGIRLETASGPADIPQSAVAEVRKTRSRLVRVAQIGALGAGIGIGIAAALLAATGGSDETEAIVVTGAAIGGGIGAAAGAALPSGSTVYRRP